MKNKIIIFSCLLIFVCCLSAVCAADVSNTCDNSTINEDNENIVADTPSNNLKLNVNSEEILSVDEVRKIGSSSQNTLGYSCEDLQNLVDHAGNDAVISLDHDYTFSNNKVLNINKGNGHLTIDGQGHSIYFKDRLSHIESKNGIITLKNLKIIGCNKDTSGNSALSLTDSASFTLINCTFQDNAALWGGAVNAIGKSKVNINGCSFINNFALYGGAVSTKCECIISESYFSNNRAGEGGAVYSTNIVTVRNSVFVDNTAQIYAAISSGDDVKFISSIAANNKAPKENNCPVHSNKMFYEENSIVREQTSNISHFLILLGLDSIFKDKLFS